MTKGWTRRLTASASTLLASAALCGAGRAAAPHNVILFVADGLRAASVTPESAPTMASLAMRGVSFRNSHSVYPTLTTVNASALATGHLPGDTGEFGNTLYLGYASKCPQRPGGPAIGPVVFMENDCVLDEADDNLGGGDNYLNETSVLAAAFARGYQTASVGKGGPVLIQDVRRIVGLGDQTLIIDDSTNKAVGGGVIVPDDVLAAIRAAGLPDEALGRADNSEGGGVFYRGTHFDNSYQQGWFADVAAKVVIPRFKAAGKPFALVFWSRDPDGTQHNEGDSFQSLTPGINGPTSRAAIRNADNDLAELLAALKTQGLDATTDVIVVADHGFSTIGRDSATSATTKGGYDGAPYGSLPPGFVALDLASALKLPMWEPTDMGKFDALPIETNRAGPRGGDAILGEDNAAPDVVVASNGGSDLIYLPTAAAAALAPRIVAALQAQDYTGGVFVRDDLGAIPGTLPMSVIDLTGGARTPTPAIVVGFRTYTAPGCTLGPLLCNVEIADTPLQTGQGMHGTFSRPDTDNFMAAVGPDFKQGYVDPAPVGNVDMGITMARLLGLQIAPKGAHMGRVVSEALVGGVETPSTPGVVRSMPGPGGLTMTLVTQTAGGRTYYDAAGYPGRVVGVP